ncbi:MAG: hypothetical protein E6H10_11660, partial [Bacteroidetes bacterium]
MIKPIKFTFLFLCLWGQSFTQTRQTIDSLRNQLTIAKDDTSRNNALIGLCYSYRLGNTDSSLFYGELALESAQQTDYHKGEIRVPQDIARVLLNLISNAFYAVDEKKR